MMLVEEEEEENSCPIDSFMVGQAIFQVWAEAEQSKPQDNLSHIFVLGWPLVVIAMMMAATEEVSWRDRDI